MKESCGSALKEGSGADASSAGASMSGRRSSSPSVGRRSVNFNRPPGGGGDPAIDLQVALEAVNAQSADALAERLHEISNAQEAGEASFSLGRFARRTFSQGSSHSSQGSTSPKGSSPSPQRRPSITSRDRSPFIANRFSQRAMSRDLKSPQRFSSRFSGRSLLADRAAPATSADPTLKEMQRLEGMRAAANLDVTKLGRAVGTLSDGDTFGEQSFLTGDVCTATIRTESFVEILSLKHSDLSVVFEAYPAVRVGVEQYAERQRQIHDQKNKEAHEGGVGNKRRSSVRGMRSIIDAATAAVQHTKRNSITAASRVAGVAAAATATAAIAQEDSKREDSRRRWSRVGGGPRRSAGEWRDSNAGSKKPVTAGATADDSTATDPPADERAAVGSPGVDPDELAA